MQVRYNLTGKRADTAYILLVFHHSMQGSPLRYYTGEKVKASDWLHDKQQLRRGAAGAAQINHGLKRLEGIVLDVFRSARNDGRMLDPSEFRALVDAHWKGGEGVRKAKKVSAAEDGEFVSFFLQLNEERYAAGLIARATYLGNRTTANKIAAFSRHTKSKIAFDAVDMDFHASFLAWLRSNGAHPNSVAKYLKRIKEVMRAAHERHMTRNIAWSSKAFTAKRWSTDSVYLTPEEVEALSLADFSANKKLQKVRDLMLVACYTGLRFSDYHKVKPQNIVTVNGVRIIRPWMEKTDKKVTIPVLPELEPVLERWGGSAPPAMSNQKFNKYIKEACKAAGIVGEETITKWSGGMRVTVSPQKHTLITSHTGRRSFATNEYMRCIRDGRDWSYLVDIMGHSSTKQFFQYIKVESEERAAAFAIDRAKPLNKKAG